MLPNLDEIREAFFEAMENGYASSATKVAIAELPGSKLISHVWGNYTISDCYFTSSYSDISSGMTLIAHLGKPVWTMHYGGRYAKIAIPFLKECLKRAYVDERRFFGGRGPEFVRDDRFTYHNHIEQGSFQEFKGIEFIHDLSEHPLGYHWYRGMSLLKQR